MTDRVFYCIGCQRWFAYSDSHEVTMVDFDRKMPAPGFSAITQWARMTRPVLLCGNCLPIGVQNG